MLSIDIFRSANETNCIEQTFAHEFGLFELEKVVSFNTIQQYAIRPDSTFHSWMKEYHAMKLPSPEAACNR